MRSVFAVCAGILATFGLTVVMASLAFNEHSVVSHLPFFELAVACPLIAIVVGVLIGLIAKDRAQAAAVFGMAPWVMFLVFEAGKGRHRGPAVSWWLIMLAVASVYFGLGIVAAVLTGRRMVSRDAPSVTPR